MYRFYVENHQRDLDTITITGGDVNHIRNVLRIRIGDRIVICNGQGKEFYCIIAEVSEREVLARIEKEEESKTELTTKMYLYQGLPKKDKMELIIQKAVELGVYEIIPVITNRTIVKIEDKKKEEKKLERWQSICEAAAKQSMRGILPRVHEPVLYKEALQLVKAQKKAIIPFEHETDMIKTKKTIAELRNQDSIGIFIGPEGGFEEEEIKQAVEQGIMPITLGKRILRTETAGLAVLSILMYELENDIAVRKVELE